MIGNDFSLTYFSIGDGGLARLPYFERDGRRRRLYHLLLIEDLKLLYAAIRCERPLMDSYSSGEEVILKTRKPYTITKQRERWTEDEHDRFIEALKLYGRAWQRIEEHIGTKTAVQIRSHAQKFFSKLEKEALIKGIPLGQALDIEIPPPRPKRKPSNPYPRKTSTGDPQSSLVKDRKLVTPASHLHAGKQLLDLEKNDPPPEKTTRSDKSIGAKEILNEDNHSEVLTLFEEVSCTSYSSVSKNSVAASSAPKCSSTFRDYVPSVKDKDDRGASDASYLTLKAKVSQKLDRTDANFKDLNSGVVGTLNLETSGPSSHDELVQGVRADEPKKPEMLSLFSTNEIFPRHVPLQSMDAVSGTSTQTLGPDFTYPASIMQKPGGAHGNPNMFINPTTSASIECHSNMPRSSVHQSLPTFPPPFTTMCNNQDTYQSFLNFPATFPSLLVSALLQNPTDHAAACLAASFWPCTNVEAFVGSLGGFPFRQISTPPSLAAVAAATVAAASAWWAAHGLLPLCLPLHSGFNCVPSPPTAIPSTDTDQAAVVNKDKKDNYSQDPPSEDKQLDPGFSVALKRDIASKSPTVSSSDSENGGTRSNCGEGKDYVQTPMQVSVLQDSSKGKTRKQVDRSSCGSNTASSSEVETYALEKHEKGEEELKEIDLIHVSGEPNNRRSRSASNVNESWKEVSEEGRIAFQALFSRQVLPQSFSSPVHLISNGNPKSSGEKGSENMNEKGEKATLQLEISSKTWVCCAEQHLGAGKDESVKSGNNPCEETGSLMAGLGHGRLKARRTGFKPYKRCSVEAKENRVGNGGGTGEEKGPKRIRVEAEAST